MADGTIPSAADVRGRRTSKSIVRVLVFGLSILPCAMAAVAPIWVAPAEIDAWTAMLHLDELQHRALYGAALAIVLSLVGLKMLVPLLVALAWLDGGRVSFAALAVWAFAVVASFVVVVGSVGRFIPQLDQIDGSAVAAMAFLWACVEVIGSLAPAALVATSRPSPTQMSDAGPAVAGPVRPQDNEASASSAPSANDIFERLLEVRSSPVGWRFGVVEHDGWICTSHRRLATAFGMPKNSLARRLSWLKQTGRIKIISTERETRILLIGDAAGNGNGNGPRSTPQ